MEARLSRITLKYLGHSIFSCEGFDFVCLYKVMPFTTTRGQPALKGARGMCQGQVYSPIYNAEPGLWTAQTQQNNIC